MGFLDDITNGTDWSRGSDAVGGVGRGISDVPILGNFWGPLVGQKSTLQRKEDEGDKAAAQQIQDNKSLYGNIALPNLKEVHYQGPDAAPDAAAERAQAVGAGPSAMNGVSTNPSYSRAQEAQMAALGNLAANGGRNAASDANLASIEAQENANAKGQRDAIMQNANMRGMGGSGASLLAQLDSSQNATNNQSARDLGVQANQANTAIQAGQAAAGIGSNLQNTEFNQQAQRAAANDAIAKFNAQNATGVNEFNAQQGTGVDVYNSQKAQGVNNARAGAANATQQTNNLQIPEETFTNSMERAKGETGANNEAIKYYGNQADIAARTQGNIFGGILGIGSSVAAAASRGGRVPGMAPVSGDSPLNDIVPVHTSPGEVVVPRSLALGGSKGEIGDFVQHAPPINTPRPQLSPDKRKEAMLSALKNLGRR